MVYLGHGPGLVLRGKRDDEAIFLLSQILCPWDFVLRGYPIILLTGRRSHVLAVLRSLHDHDRDHNMDRSI